MQTQKELNSLNDLQYIENVNCEPIHSMTLNADLQEDLASVSTANIEILDVGISDSSEETPEQIIIKRKMQLKRVEQHQKKVMVEKQAEILSVVSGVSNTCLKK